MKKIFFVFLIWRIGLFLVAFFSLSFLSFSPRYPYWKEILLSSGLPSWIWTWAGFDGVHYLTIAKSGYSAQFTQAFFPLYPLLIKIVNPLLGGNFVLTGLINSNFFFLLAVFLFLKLLDFENQKKNQWPIIFLFLFPTSFFFGSLYNESLFLSLIFGVFLLAKKKKWWLAGILGGLASATRLVGIFLLPALLIEWFQQDNIKNQIEEIKKAHQNLIRKLFRFFNIISYSLPLFLVSCGLIGYMSYLKMAFSDSLYFLHAQPYFGASRTGETIILLPQVIWRYLKIFLSVPLGNYEFWVALFEFLVFWLVFFLLIFAHKQKIRISYLIFSWLSFLTPTLTGTFSSLPRYVLPLFPIYIVLGNIENKRIKIILALLSGMCLIIATSFFTSGRWVS